MFKKRNIKKDSSKRKLEFETETERPLEGEVSGLKNRVKKPRMAEIRSQSSDGSKSDDKDDHTHKNGDKNSDTQTDTVLMTRNDAVMDTSKKEGSLSAIPVNVRTTTITDFQPDVCKDFQQTGYCGYGDTCKFLHIRSETRAKKPVVREWETVSKKEEKKEEDSVPFKCVLCKEDYKSPIRTVCNHVFCRGCFSKRFSTKKSCFICGKPTDGIMSPVSSDELQKMIG